MRRRRAIVVFLFGTAVLAFLAAMVPSAIEQGWSAVEQRWVTKTAQQESPVDHMRSKPGASSSRTALGALDALEVKGRASKTGYDRDQFGNGWASLNGCNTRAIILYRDLQNPVLQDECTVVSGTLLDPYTGKTIVYKKENSSAVQIDHVVALSDAWQKGAQSMSAVTRQQLANDPLELLAVEGTANQAKSDADAATWLPSNKSFRCHYVARQITVKKKYTLWVTDAEKTAMQSVLRDCPEQELVTP